MTANRPTDPHTALPPQSPLYHAQHADQYDRQRMIGAYSAKFSCRLIVMIDVIFDPSVTMFEELIYDADPRQDLHLLLNSRGGDGEVALRLVRSAQARCRELTVIIPNQAKSAATLLTIGAHHILMGPASDLGPIDPQFMLGDELVSAKDIIAAVDDATLKVQQSPATYPIYASLLSDMTALIVQKARSALDRTEDQLEEALKSNPDRNEDQVGKLKENLSGPLISMPKSHAALYSAIDAKAAELPVQEANPQSEQWQMIWRLWAKYSQLALQGQSIYEGRACFSGWFLVTPLP